MKFKEIKSVNTDLLIIGGGSTGLWAAKRFKEKNPDGEVVIVEKGPEDWGGQMAISGGDFDVIFPGENVDDWVKDLVYYWDGLCDQERMKALLEGIYDRFVDYEEMGCQYKDEEGNYKGVPQRHLDHFKLYVTKEKGFGGEHMRQVMIEQMEKHNVKKFGRTIIVDLIKKDGAVVGAYGFDFVNEVFYIFHAKAVVLATGPCSWKTSYGKNNATGEWVDMALDAGASLKNFEFSRVWNAPISFSWEGQTTLLPLGAKFANKDGEDFMKKYSPNFGSNTDPHYVTLGMAFEARKGKAPIYFDISDLDKSKIDVIKPKHGWQVLNYEKLKEKGLDFFEDKIEWVPKVTGNYGGIVTDVYGHTGVDGLYAAGTICGNEPGVYIGGSALSQTAQSGYITGQKIAEEFLNNEINAIEFSDDEIVAEKERLENLIGKGKYQQSEILEEIQSIIFPYNISIIKSEKSLKAAIEKLDKVKGKLDSIVANDFHDLSKLIELKGMYRSAQLYLEGSLRRTESRGGHYREDYPTYNDEEWLAWLYYKKDKDGNIVIDKERVPIEKYPFKIEKHYADNFNFK